MKKVWTGNAGKQKNGIDITRLCDPARRVDGGNVSVNRYIADYRIVESIDERGRIRSGYEYIGAAYDYAGNPETVRRARRGVAWCCVVGWTAYAIALLPVSVATHTLYTALPFAFIALPLFMISGLCAALFRQKPPFEHRYADRLENRGPACSFFMALLGAIALVGEAVNAVRGGLLPGDAAFAAGAAALLICGIVCHRRWRDLKCREKR